MTFREKLQTELPNEICKGVPSACPYTYEYEKYGDRPCKDNGLPDYAFCENCWNREIPNTESKAEIDASDYINIYTEGHGKGYTEGLSDAWELLKRVAEMPDAKICEHILEGDSLNPLRSMVNCLTPQEALAKLKAYEERIEVGDVVTYAGEKGMVLDSIPNKFVVLTYDGWVQEWYWGDVEKTDKHVDIKSILEQIGE